MLRVFFDHDLANAIIRGLRREIRDMDSITALEAGLHELPDQEVLRWAARENRIVISHDRNTMTKFAYELIREREKFSGLILVPQKLGIGKALDHLVVLICCSGENEWSHSVVYLPRQ